MSDHHGILATAIALLTTSLVWAFLRGEDAPLSWLMAGAGSITLGVWLGIVVAGPTLLTDKDDEQP